MGKPMTLRKSPVLTSTHPLVRDGSICPACNKLFEVGQSVTLIAFGPGDDPNEQRKARMGQPFVAQATAVHWACATGDVL